MKAFGDLSDGEGCFLPQAGGDLQLGRIAFGACGKIGLLLAQAAQFLGDEGAGGLDGAGVFVAQRVKAGGG